MTESLVDVVERDLREVVETEIKKFLERYDECEIVDNIVINEDMCVAKYDVVVHSLPCSIYRNFVISSIGVYEIGEMKCFVTYEDEVEEEDMGYVVVGRIADKCFINWYVWENTIRKIARKIVEEAEAGE
jgi:hypothetical protein